MFTGIIEELGTITRLDVADGHARLEVACQMVASDAGIGDSIAVNGCCLTVTELLEGGGFGADLMAETVALTSLASLAVNDQVNLERAMSASTRFGGHIVQGHVDGVGIVSGRVEQPGTVFLAIRVPAHLATYVVAKGSITLDGTSLTVVDVTPVDEGVELRVALIPHTLKVTTWGARVIGDHINVEADVIAKYVERMLAGGVATPYNPAETAEQENR
ncbi:MAG: riboflavin synthase [Glaciecola sp.]|jgi:riboflavin synthase